MDLRFSPIALLTVACLSAAPVASTAAPQESAARQRNVAILIYPGVELLDFSGPGEAFSAAQGAGGRAFRVFTVAETRDPLVSQGFVRVTPEFTIDDCPKPDIVVLPGGAVPDRDPELLDWVRECSRSAELVMSVCNGALLLGNTGLLDGLQATTHHSALQALALQTPKATVYSNRRFVDSGAVMTCAGVSAGIDGALHVIERMLGAQAARDTAYYMEYDWRPEEIAKKHAEPGLAVVEGLPMRLARAARTKGVPAALADYRAAAEKPSERELNNAGYGLMSAGKREEALALLQLTAAAFPDSANAHDSLSEACEFVGDAAGAKTHATKALELLKTSKLEPALVQRMQHASASRLARLGEGDASALRFTCGPCGGECDQTRFLPADACPVCGMALVEVGAAELAEQKVGKPARQ